MVFKFLKKLFKCDTQKARNLPNGNFSLFQKCVNGRKKTNSQIVFCFFLRKAYVQRGCFVPPKEINSYKQRGDLVGGVLSLLKKAYMEWGCFVPLYYGRSSRGVLVRGLLSLLNKGLHTVGVFRSGVFFPSFIKSYIQQGCFGRGCFVPLYYHRSSGGVSVGGVSAWGCFGSM